MGRSGVTRAPALINLPYGALCLFACLLVVACFVVADFKDLPLKLELELVMSHLTLVMLGTRLGSSGKAANALTESDCD